jgi:hypothetical protein
LLSTANAGFVPIFKRDLEETETFLASYLECQGDEVRQLELENELEAAERNNNPMKLSSAAFKEMILFIENRFPNCELDKGKMDRLREIYKGKNSAYSTWVTKHKDALEKAAAAPEPKAKKLKSAGKGKK